MAPSPKATETVSSQSESKEENDSTQQASDVLSEANCHPASKYPVKGTIAKLLRAKLLRARQVPVTMPSPKFLGAPQLDFEYFVGM
jgi:hypothetical protein